MDDGCQGSAGVVPDLAHRLVDAFVGDDVEGDGPHPLQLALGPYRQFRVIVRAVQAPRPSSRWVPVLKKATTVSAGAET